MTIKTYIINSITNEIVDILDPSINIQEFTSSGIYYKTDSVNIIDVVVVGGGGGGKGSSSSYYGGYGGEAGEIKTETFIITDNSINIIIGDGGQGGFNYNGENGENTSIGDLLVSLGGNGGSLYNTTMYGRKGETGYGTVLLAEAGEDGTYGGIAGVGYGAGGGGSRSSYGTFPPFTYYNGGDGASGYVKIIEYLPHDYIITEQGIYHIFIVDDSNNTLSAYTAPNLKITDPRRIYNESQNEFSSDIIFGGEYSSIQSVISFAYLIFDSEFYNWEDLSLNDLSLSIDIYVDDSENIDTSGTKEISFWDGETYSNKLYYELDDIIDQLISGEYVNFIIPLSDFTNSSFNTTDVKRLDVLLSPIADYITVEFQNAKLIYNKNVNSYVKLNNISVENCKVYSILNEEIIDIVYTDFIGNYSIYAPENSIILVEPPIGYTERPKKVII